MESQSLAPELLTYFEVKLRQWHQSLVTDNYELLKSIQQETHQEADHIDRSATQEDWESRFQLLHSKEKILQEIETALHRISDGSFGYSELSGSPISIKRLEAWPIARYTVQEEEERERKSARFF